MCHIWRGQKPKNMIHYNNQKNTVIKIKSILQENQSACGYINEKE